MYSHVLSISTYIDTLKNDQFSKKLKIDFMPILISFSVKQYHDQNMPKTPLKTIKKCLKFDIDFSKLMKNSYNIAII